MALKKQNAISDTANAVINVFFIFYAIVCIAPLLLVFMISITDEQALANNGYSFIPQIYSLKAYVYIFRDSGAVGRAYMNTIIATAAGTFFEVLFTAMFAYPLSRKDFKYRNGFSFFIYFTMLFSGGLVPWYLVCVRILHIKNTIFALFVPYLLSAWNIFIMRTFFATSIPDSIVDSARIDGAGEMKTFFSIIIPLSTPVLATIALFSSIAFWNDWWLPLMLTTKERYVNLQYMLQRIQQNIEFILQMQNTNGGVTYDLVSQIPSESFRMAMCIIAIGPIILVYPFLQKYFVKGLTIGSVKG